MLYLDEGIIEWTKTEVGVCVFSKNKSIGLKFRKRLIKLKNIAEKWIKFS